MTRDTRCFGVFFKMGYFVFVVLGMLSCFDVVLGLDWILCRCVLLCFRLETLFLGSTWNVVFFPKVHGLATFWEDRFRAKQKVWLLVLGSPLRK